MDCEYLNGTNIPNNMMTKKVSGFFSVRFTVGRCMKKIYSKSEYHSKVNLQTSAAASLRAAAAAEASSRAAAEADASRLTSFCVERALVHEEF